MDAAFYERDPSLALREPHGLGHAVPSARDGEFDGRLQGHAGPGRHVGGAEIRLRRRPDRRASDRARGAYDRQGFAELQRRAGS